MMLWPRDSHHLRLLAATVAPTPPARLRCKRGVSGNSVAIASFEDESDVPEFVSTNHPAAPLDVASLIEP